MAIAETNGIKIDDVYLVNLDNDNVITPAFLNSVCQIAQEQLHGDPGSWAILCQWTSPEPGLTGRIGMPATLWSKFGGYDQELTGMGLRFCAFFLLPPCPVDDPSF